MTASSSARSVPLGVRKRSVGRRALYCASKVPPLNSLMTLLGCGPAAPCPRSVHGIKAVCCWVFTPWNALGQHPWRLSTPSYQHPTLHCCKGTCAGPRAALTSGIATYFNGIKLYGVVRASHYPQ